MVRSTALALALTYPQITHAEAPEKVLNIGCQTPKRRYRRGRWDPEAVLRTIARWVNLLLLDEIAHRDFSQQMTPAQVPCYRADHRGRIIGPSFPALTEVANDQEELIEKIFDQYWSE